MPLHLLGKKSWHVYNTDNILRVKRDEAAALAREEAEEQRQQEADAERRLAILRGEIPPSPRSSPPRSTIVTEENVRGSRSRKREESDVGRKEQRRKRKRVGEDDTDFELRLARERQALVPRLDGPGNDRGKRSNAPLVNHAGHIDLFPEEHERAQKHSQQKNEEAEREAAKKRREFEDQYTMRFSNAAGNRHQEDLIGSGPWYAKGGNMDEAVANRSLELTVGKDVWGNEDPKRQEREASRVVANDPLSLIKRGAAKVREVDRERKALNEEKEREMRLLRKEDRRRERRRRRGGATEKDRLKDELGSLEGFHLESSVQDDKDFMIIDTKVPGVTEIGIHWDTVGETRASTAVAQTGTEMKDADMCQAERNRRQSARADHY